MKLLAAFAVLLMGSAGITLADDTGSSRGTSGSESGEGTRDTGTPAPDSDPSHPSQKTSPEMQGGVPGAFEGMDANRDGKISATEASRMQAADFRKLDTDQNGTLDRKEWMKGPTMKGGASSGARGATFDSLDANGDGSVSKAEAAAIYDSASFEKADRNRNGVLDRNEYGPLSRNRGGPASPSMDK